MHTNYTPSSINWKPSANLIHKFSNSTIIIHGLIKLNGSTICLIRDKLIRFLIFSLLEYCPTLYIKLPQLQDQMSPNVLGFSCSPKSNQLNSRFEILISCKTFGSFLYHFLKIKHPERKTFAIFSQIFDRSGMLSLALTPCQ